MYFQYVGNRIQLNYYVRCVIGKDNKSMFPMVIYIVNIFKETNLNLLNKFEQIFHLKKKILVMSNVLLQLNNIY